MSRRSLWQTHARSPGLLACALPALRRRGDRPGAGDARRGHLGVPLIAPDAPTVDGLPASTVTYAWQRCLLYSTLVTADGAADYGRWPTPTTAAGTRSAPPPVITWGRMPPFPTAPLVGEGDPAAAFDGKTSAVSSQGRPTTGVTALHARVVGPPEDDRGSYRFLISHEETISAGRQGTGIWLSSSGLGSSAGPTASPRRCTTPPGLPLGKWSSRDRHLRRLDDEAICQRRAGRLARNVGAADRPARRADRDRRGRRRALGLLRRRPRRGRALPAGDHPQPRERALRAATSAPCTTIAGADGSTYTPVARRPRPHALGDRDLHQLPRQRHRPRPEAPGRSTTVTATSCRQRSAG